MSTTVTQPSIKDTEKATLGYLLNSPEDTREWLLSELDSGHFHTPDNQRIFLAVKQIGDDGLSLNPVSLKERCKSVNQHGYIDEVYQASSGIGKQEIRTLVSDLKRVHSLRLVASACSEARSRISITSSADEILEELEQKLYSIGGHDRSQIAEASEAAEVVFKDFLAGLESGEVNSISTGFKSVDRAILGAMPGQMWVMAARPSVGKSAMCGSVSGNILDQGFGVMTMSYEMTKEELIQRELARRANVDVRKLIAKRGVLPEEMTRLFAAMNYLKSIKHRWYIDDFSSGFGGARRKARMVASKMQRKGVKLALVTVDYLQLAADGDSDNRQESVSSVSRDCKKLAKELSCTVMALSQLNRSCESRDDKRPMLSDLRESGAIEQDADIVSFLYRDALYNSEADAEDAELIIRKQRNGPVGTCRLKFCGKTASYSDPEE